MLSARCFLRSACCSTRTSLLSASRLPARPLNNLRGPFSAHAKCSFKPICPAPASFRTSALLHESEGQVNAELAGKLGQELALEKEMRDPEIIPDHLKEFLDNTPFQLHDTRGSEEIVMTRTFGDEKIKVTFSVDDLNNVEEDADQIQDHGMEDEFDDPAEIPTDTQSHGGNTKGAINQGQTSGGNFKVAPEDTIEASESLQSDDAVDQDSEPSFPAHLLVTIERAKKGTLQIEAIAQDGLIVVDNVYFYKDSALADPKTAEQEKQAARSYTGPPFGNLDEDLQILFENYLSERGINTTMALFVPEYIDFKEQREYMQWLSDVQAFVE